MSFPEIPHVRRASREMVRHLGMLDHCCGMPNSHAHALIEIGEQDRATAVDLAETLSLDKSSTSRILSQLARKGLVARIDAGTDKRKRPVTLTAAGRTKLAEIHAVAEEPVKAALTMLRPEQRAEVVRGLSHYARALRKAGFMATVTIREIRPEDNPAVAVLIRDTLAEYGAVGPGYAYDDPEVDAMFETYDREDSRYFVVQREGRIIGGGGYGPLAGDGGKICELQKMYFLPEHRGMGLGSVLIRRCLEGATEAGYEGMYLETLTNMDRAQRLYAGFGFARIDTPMGHTGHCGCDRWYYRALPA